MPQYVVLQVTLKEKLVGTASKNLGELEKPLILKLQRVIAYIQFQLHPLTVPVSVVVIEFRPLWCLRNYSTEKEDKDLNEQIT